VHIISAIPPVSTSAGEGRIIGAIAAQRVPCSATPSRGKRCHPLQELHV
jgi:hypothetical protein